MALPDPLPRAGWQKRCEYCTSNSPSRPCEDASQSRARGVHGLQQLRMMMMMTKAFFMHPIRSLCLRLIRSVFDNDGVFVMC